jgi:tetratricopeptide (TPR) repeat protein
MASIAQPVPTRLRWPIVLGLALAGLAVYWNSLSGTFIWDDRTGILGDPGVLHLGSPRDYLSARGFTRLTFALNVAIGGLDVRGFHVVNIAIHILASTVLYGVVRRTLARLRPSPTLDSDWLAGAIALLWLIHPLQTQAVTYLVQRHESLMGLCYLTTLYCAIRHFETRKSRWALLAIAFCLLGMMTKQVMVTAPLAVLLYSRTFIDPSFSKSIARHRILFVGLLGSWLWLWFLLGGGQMGQMGNPVQGGPSAGFAYQGATPRQYLVTQSQVLLHYLRLSVWPNPLCLDYVWPLAEATRVIPELLMVSSLVAVSLFGLWRRHWVGFVGTCFFMILAPTSSIMPIADVAEEHRMYLPLATVVSLGVVLLWKIGERTHRRYFAAGIAVLAVACAIGTVLRNRDYQDGETMWRKVIALRPGNSRARNNLANLLMDKHRFLEASDVYRAALELEPDSPVMLYNLGRALALTGNYAAALPYLQEAVVRASALSPDLTRVHFHHLLGIVLRRLGRLDEAILQLREAAELEPTSSALRLELEGALKQRSAD